MAMAADAHNVIINAMNQCSDPRDRVCVNEKFRATKDLRWRNRYADVTKRRRYPQRAVINEAKDGKLSVFCTVVNS